MINEIIAKPIKNHTVALKSIDFDSFEKIEKNI